MKLSQRELLEIFCGKTVINKSINEGILGSIGNVVGNVAQATLTHGLKHLGSIAQRTMPITSNLLTGIKREMYVNPKKLALKLVEQGYVGHKRDMPDNPSLPEWIPYKHPITHKQIGWLIVAYETRPQKGKHDLEYIKHHFYYDLKGNGLSARARSTIRTTPRAASPPKPRTPPAAPKPKTTGGTKGHK